MEYSVIFSKRKTISISVNKGCVVVKAPLGTDRKTIEEILLKHSKWIDKHLILQKKKEALTSGLTDQDIKEIKKKARIYFKEKTEHYASIMGLKYGRITITSAQKRFGSCSSEGNISYSYRLMLYPEAAREYVVVHELAHFKEMNHSSKFYSIIEKILPDYKARKRLLK
jgi:predicted metal-dependent hydrolase